MKKIKDPSEREKTLLREQLRQAGLDVDNARSAFDMAVEPDLVAACIYELNAAKLRYSNLLKQLRSMELPAREA
jgi:hypothetical protein